MSVIEISESQSFPSVLNVKRGPELRRYVPERTCRNELSGYTDCMGRPVPDQFRCSECGEHSQTMVDVGFGEQPVGNMVGHGRIRRRDEAVVRHGAGIFLRAHAIAAARIAPAHIAGARHAVLPLHRVKIFLKLPECHSAISRAFSKALSAIIHDFSRSCKGHPQKF